MDFTQICINSRYGHDNKPIKFGDLDLIFKVTLEKKMLNLGQKYYNAHYLQIGLANLAQIRMNLIHGRDKKLFKIWGP